ncbi:MULTISPECIES: selenide, water dikinase SelD [unclassified Paenibacillus]|uniref:selenide, water dikinase SelD n=1 Tax=unclassified Paenibacillus TaxID=185978 RepID=UPI00030EEE87|nr:MULTISPECIES: selenide, water dikinase SelD [unclassified Paenibacillus]MCM3338196.1 selenide, water dikinase SelD [Paenibacillus sp. MER TA 81-3]
MEQQPNVRLTTLSSKGGCGCKIGPADLAQVLRQLPATEKHPDLIVGLDTSDDAGVFRLNDELAIVQTVDFFTPIVDEPYAFGQVAAANALSDIYAMGGKPLTALNIVAFPISKLDKSILAEILRGAGDKVKEAGATLVGGHSIDDAEPKFGMAVTGIIHPDKVLTNAGARPGDKLVLTKPIGVGIMTTSLKRELLQPDEIELVTKTMTMLNKTAAEVMADYEVHACTDVTGFGLLGHGSELAQGSQTGLHIYAESVPVLPRVRELAEQGAVPGGTKNNFNHVKDNIRFDGRLDEISQLILCDAVTSGGLLLSVAEADAEALLQAMNDKGIAAACIGEVVAEHPGEITVTGHAVGNRSSK